MKIPDRRRKGNFMSEHFKDVSRTAARVLVIGGGASGLMAAIAAAKAGAKVTVLDGMQKAGRKLLMTGNGRCNLTSLDPELPNRYHSSDPEAVSMAASAVFSNFSVQDTLDFFTREGLLLHSRDTYVYPHSDQAASVLRTLLDCADRLGVTIRCQTPAREIRKGPQGQGIRVRTDGWEYEADAVILCAGSKAVSATGSDGSGYDLAASTGHTIIPVVPALTALCVKDRLLPLAAGARSDACLTLFLDDDTKPALRERGELQWTKDALSGIAVFQVSSLAARALYEERDVKLCVDLVPEMEEEALMSFLEAQIKAVSFSGEKDAGSRTLSSVLQKIINDRIASYLLARSALKSIPVSALKHGQIRQICGLLKNLSFTADHTRGFENAQTCSGGVSLREVDPETLQSRRFEGLYFAGEILDIDGPCGGYNLQWAWSSGYTAGNAAAKRY